MVDIDAWKEEQERVENIEDIPKTSRERYRQGTFTPLHLTLTIDAIQEELEKPNIAGACFMLGELREYLMNKISEEKITFEE